MTKLRELHARGVKAASCSWAKTRNVGRPTGSSENSGLTQPSSSAPAVERLLDLDAAHRQRLALRADRAESPAPPLGLTQQVDVDLDLVDLLHAADVRVPELLVRVDERARPVDARGRVDDLVAVHPAPPALDLVLRMKGERLGGGAAGCHTGNCGDPGIRCASLDKGGGAIG